MTDVITALAAMAAVVGAGWLIQVRGWLPAGSRELLATVVFTVAGPCLLLATVAQADLGRLASIDSAVTWTASLSMGAVLVAVGRWALRLPTGRAIVTALSGSYVNAGNLGIPLAVYMFGDALAVVPTMLVQMLVMAPVSFAILGRAADARPVRSAAAGAPGRPTRAARRGTGGDGDSVPRSGGRGGWLGSIVGNPMTAGTLIGLALALLPWSVPQAVLAPFDLVGAAAPPLALLTLGMALVGVGGARAAERRAGDPDRVSTSVLIATVASVVVHPLVAWGLGSLAGLSGTALAVVVAMAALPTAQNVVVFATRYGCALDVASRACVATTALCGPVMIVIAALLL